MVFYGRRRSCEPPESCTIELGLPSTVITLPPDALPVSDRDTRASRVLPPEAPTPGAPPTPAGGTVLQSAPTVAPSALPGGYTGMI